MARERERERERERALLVDDNFTLKQVISELRAQSRAYDTMIKKNKTKNNNPFNIKQSISN